MGPLLTVTLGLAAIFLGIAAFGAPGGRVVATELGLLGVGFAGVPVAYALRLAGALRTGRVSFARVESIEHTVPFARDTLDALEHGIARATWRIADGPALEFEIDDAWTSQLRVGSCVDVLVGGRGDARVYPLGPSKGWAA